MLPTPAIHAKPTRTKIRRAHTGAPTASPAGGALAASRPRRALCRAAAAALLLFDAVAARGASLPICEREMTRAAGRYEIPLNILYSVGLTETGNRGTLSPYDMNVDGRA